MPPVLRLSQQCLRPMQRPGNVLESVIARQTTARTPEASPYKLHLRKRYSLSLCPPSFNFSSSLESWSSSTSSATSPSPNSAASVSRSSPSALVSASSASNAATPSTDRRHSPRWLRQNGRRQSPAKPPPATPANSTPTPAGSASSSLSPAPSPTSSSPSAS